MTETKVIHDGDDSEGSVDLEGCLGMMDDPDGFFKPPPQPTTVVFKRSTKRANAKEPSSTTATATSAVAETATENGRKCGKGKEEIRLGLVANHALWAHHLWNGSRVISEMIDDGDIAVGGKRVLELGAGAALPSIVALLNGAEFVTATDFPERPLLENAKSNIEENTGERVIIGSNVVGSGGGVGVGVGDCRANVVGLLWGSHSDDSEALLRSVGASRGFDVVLMADLLANHSAQRDLARTLSQCLSRDGGVAYVAYSHHRPWLASRDDAFFGFAEAEGLVCSKLFEKLIDPMFPDDPGELSDRSTVHVWSISWPSR